MDLFARLDHVRERFDVLRHPFYRRWSEGALEPGELGRYAGQYRHAVRALSDQTAACARSADDEATARELAEHAAEEREHLDLWDDFGAAFGAEGEHEPRPETAACATAWTAGDDLLERLAVLYAVEASQPAISEVKLAGLIEHYDVEEGSPEAAYFALHAARDHEHAAHSRVLIDSLASAADADRLVARAEAALRANWELLDGVEARR